MQVQATAGTAVPAEAAEFARERRDALAHAGGHAAVPGESTYRPQCGECGGTPVVGETVRLQHAQGCRHYRRGIARLVPPLRRMIPQPRSACDPATRPVPAAEDARTAPGTAPAAARDVRQRNPRGTGLEAVPGPREPGHDTHEGDAHRRRWDPGLRRAGIRPWVVLRWFVSGCRVAVDGWTATARRVREAGGRLKVRLDFDDPCWDSGEYDILTDLDWASPVQAAS